MTTLGDDWPVAAMWNSLLASFIFDQGSTASLIRELNRNSQLRDVCGFQPHFHTGKDGAAKLMPAPSASAYTNFINNLRECREELREMFDRLVAYMYENLSDFGDILMTDGKAYRALPQNYPGKPATIKRSMMRTGAEKHTQLPRHREKWAQRL